MRTYRNVSTQQRWVRRANVVVKPGETFQCDFEINDANFAEVKDDKRKAADPAAHKED